MAEEAQEQGWHWRDTMRPVRFFKFDARAAIPFFVLLVYFRIVTVVLTIVITLIFWFLEKRGLTFSSALRSLRTWLIGDRRPAFMPYRHRRMRDYV